MTIKRYLLLVEVVYHVYVSDVGPDISFGSTSLRLSGVERGTVVYMYHGRHIDNVHIVYEGDILQYLLCLSKSEASVLY